MLTLDVMPERSLGCEQWEFILGMHFAQAVTIIQSRCDQIKDVEVMYNDTNPLESDIIITLTHDGIRLFFDPISQRLKMIEVIHMRKVRLRYCNSIFNSEEVYPTLEQIEHCFGATHPGVFDAEKELFMLHFRGLVFYFPVESKYQIGRSKNFGSIQFPAGCSPTVSRVVIYYGASLQRAYAPEMPLTCYYGHVYLKKAEILRDTFRTRSLRLHLMMGQPSRRMHANMVNVEREIILGQSAQDIATLLGAPSDVFYKSEDKMRIHAPNAMLRESELRSDYFFNYFTLGLDILFDARTHMCKKFVLHTNHPGHYNFNAYMRCDFKWDLTHSLCVPTGDKQVKSNPSTHSDHKLVVTTQPISKAVPIKTAITRDDNVIDAYSRWEDICKLIKPSETPVVLNRNNSINSTNPFGYTLSYGYQDMIFEVMTSNNLIGSLTIFRDTRISECKDTEVDRT